MRRLSDFRSDTVTQPTAAMKAAMLAAELGDDVLDGDPTVRALEQRVAQLLGKQAALFVPSGTMANQVALGAWTRPGDEIVLERSAHMVQWEAGAAGFNHGVQTLTLDVPDGVLTPAMLERVLRPASLHCPKDVLVCVEQSFMGSGEGPGGLVLPLERLRELHAWCRERGLHVHMDGARLMNAVVASGVAAADYGACADSVSLCLSKGLGAPVGSLIAGPFEFVERGKLVRKRLGGWMRQCGILAAAGLHALEHHVARLEQDHALARRLAESLHGLPGLVCPPASVRTNIAMVQMRHPRHTPASLCAALKERGVLVLPMTASSLRFVTHMDVGDADVGRLASACRELLG
ncbi:MAG: aminotransferase class I/II-fold pyridoxal phosphate-dependent enzyme [Planctomycetes bacterium]|nr:aminotransferase class I/II-fold pyridoxal phosphate-dependent enzyme [Planctomycetota bacterium]